MDTKPSWWGLAGTSVVVLMCLTMNTGEPVTVEDTRLVSAEIAMPVRAALAAAEIRPVNTTRAPRERRDSRSTLRAEDSQTTSRDMRDARLNPRTPRTRAETRTGAGAQAGTGARMRVRGRGQVGQAQRLTHQTAFQRLRSVGVRWRSTGHCVDRTQPTCTSFDGIRYGTLAQTIRFKRRSHCPVTVTGGTEIGHARGRYSHGNGFKVDIAHNRCVNAYITGRFHYWKVRGDGAALYRPSSAPDADVYANEPNHWDILFR